MGRLSRDAVIAIVLLMACGILFWSTFSIRDPDYGQLKPTAWLHISKLDTVEPHYSVLTLEQSLFSHRISDMDFIGRFFKQRHEGKQVGLHTAHRSQVIIQMKNLHVYSGAASLPLGRRQSTQGHPATCPALSRQKPGHQLQQNYGSPKRGANRTRG